MGQAASIFSARCCASREAKCLGSLHKADGPFEILALSFHCTVWLYYGGYKGKECLFFQMSASAQYLNNRTYGRAPETLVQIKIQMCLQTLNKST